MDMVQAFKNLTHAKTMGLSLTTTIITMLLGPFTSGVPKKGKWTPRLLWGYFLQITFTSNKFK
jgi:hypothetical protein